MQSGKDYVLLNNHRFFKKKWTDIREGDSIYIQITTVPSDRFFGPYLVEDPEKGKLKIKYNTTIDVAKQNVQPLILESVNGN